MRRLTTVLSALLLSALCACAAPPSGPASAEPADAAKPASAATPVSATTPAAVAAPAPAQSVPAPAAAQPAASQPAVVKIDRSCRSDADCAVKDVGNCCGAMPACVNANSPTDPAGVKAACAKSGRMGVCGFRTIDRCQCTQGQCSDVSSGLDAGPEQVR